MNTILYKKYYSKIFYYALMLSKDKDVAHDIAQEAFVRVHGNPLENENSSEIEYFRYLKKIAKNLFFDLYAEERMKHNTDCESLIESDEIISKIFLMEMIDKIDQLPDRYRHCAELSYLYGFKNNEIADSLHINASTVSTRLARSKKILKGKAIRKLK